MQRLLADHQLARATVASQQPYMTSLYGPPGAELPLYDFQTYGTNAYGSTGYASSTLGNSGTSGNAVIFALIDRRMSVFTEATFQWRRLDTKKLFGSPELLPLEQPWPDGTTGDLLGRMEQDASLGGNAYVRATGDPDQPLERLRPDWVTIVSTLIDTPRGQIRRCLGFFYDPVGDMNRAPEFYPVAEVAHWAPIPDPLANFRGMSWITPVIRELSSDIRMSDYRTAFFANAATPNLVIKYTQKIAPERVDRLKTMLRARHTGVDGAYGTLVLDEGADLSVVGKDMEGSAFDKLQAATETRMAAAAGVPPIVAGLTQGLQASQIGEYSQALRAFADLKMRPNWRSVCAALQKLVQVPGNSKLWYDTTDVSALQQGEQDKAATMAGNAETLNKLIIAGFTPESAVLAVTSGDLTQLVHSGLVSVQMQKLEEKALPAEPPIAGVQPALPPAPLNGKVPALVGAGKGS